MTLVDILSAFLLAASLCADCFAVSSCSSVTLKNVNWKQVFPIALSFGIIQTALMLLGWLFGDLFVGAVEKAAGVIGFLMLLYVGGSMIFEALKNNTDSRNLNGLRNIIIGGIATSIDAFAVGISLSMDHISSKKVAIDLIAVFVVTMLSVISGIFGGYKIGKKFGRPAEIIGGTVLIIIGITILL